MSTCDTRAQLSRRGGPGDDTEQMEGFEAGHGARGGNVIAFSDRPTRTAAEALETTMWVIKICDERNEILLGFPPAIPLSEDVRQERSSRCL